MYMYLLQGFFAILGKSIIKLAMVTALQVETLKGCIVLNELINRYVVGTYRSQRALEARRFNT